MSKASGFVVLGLLLSVGGCKKEEAMAPAAKTVPEAKAPAKAPPPAPKPMTGEELASWYAGCWDSYNAGKIDDLMKCFADDVESTQIGIQAATGKAKVREIGANAYMTAFPDGKVEPQLVLVSGRHIFSVRWFHGTHTGPFRGPMGEIPATGKKVGLLVLHHVEVNDANLVAREWWSIDVPTMMFQLGLSPGPARPVMDKGWDGAPIVLVAKDDETERKNAESFKTAYALWNKKDTKGFDDFLADEIVESNNSEPADSVGKKVLQAHNAEFRKAFSDLHVDVDNVWAAGEYTASVEHARGTNDGDMGPMKKTGKAVDVTVVEVTKWKDGKVVATWPFMNGLEMATQLGLMPAAK